MFLKLVFWEKYTFKSLRIKMIFCMKTSQVSWWNKTLQVVGWLGWSLLVIVVCIRTMYLFPGTSEILTDADIIQLPTMFLDLQTNFNNFWGWKLPDAPYYFPDTVFFLIINWSVGDSWQSIVSYSILQASLVVLPLCCIYHLWGGKNLRICLLVLLGGLWIQTQIYTKIFSQVGGLATPHIYYLSSYIHFGTYIASLACLAIALAYISSNHKFWLLAVGFISFISTVSDLIFAVYFTIPFIGAMLILDRAEILPEIGLKRYSNVLFFSAFAGYIFNKYLDPLAATTTVELKLSKIYLSFVGLISDLWNSSLLDKLYLGITIILPLIYLVFYLLQNIDRLSSQSNIANRNYSVIFPLLTCLFVLNGVLFNIFAVILLGKYVDVPSARYFMVVYYSPGLVSLILLSLNWEQTDIKYKNKYKNQIQLTIAAIITIVCLNSIFSNQSASLQVASPPDYASCFDLNQPQAGLAEYWHSKPLIAYSQRKIQIATIKLQGEPNIWNNNRYWYTDSWQNPGNPPQFQFILMHSLDKDAIAKRYGQPDRIDTCTNSEVWWYDNPQQVYANLMRDGL